MCELGGWSDGQDEMGKLKEFLLFSLGKWANNETGYGRRGIDSISLSLTVLARTTPPASSRRRCDVFAHPPRFISPSLFLLALVVF